MTLNGMRFAAKMISTGTDSCVDVCAPRLPVIAASPIKWTQANAHKMQNTVDMVCIIVNLIYIDYLFSLLSGRISTRTWQEGMDTGC
jgi:hypothetical protein